MSFVRSLLSSKPGVAALCVGIAVFCILVAGFFIYRVKYKEPHRRVRVPDPKLSPSSVTRVSMPSLPPFKLGPRVRHPLRDGISRSPSSRLLPPSNGASSKVLPSGRPHQTGDLLEIRYQHAKSPITPSISALIYGFERRKSESGIVGQISDYLPSRSLERLSSATAVSMVDSSSYNSQSHLLPRSQASYPFARRPLPMPPHPPPAYDQVSGAKLSQLPIIPDNEIGNIAYSRTSTDPLTGSTLSGVQSPNLKSGFHKMDYSTRDDSKSSAPSPSAAAVPIALPLHAISNTHSMYGEPAFLRRSRRSDGLGFNDRMEDNGTLDTDDARSSRSHQRHSSGVNDDPFSNINYELPTWISSDPYPARILRSFPSQPSLYGATVRSAAASSHVLPSDTSIRTLTPEPTSPPLPVGALAAMEQEQNTSLRHSHAPTRTSAAPPTWPHSAIVGDRPPVDKILVLHGAERPGWAKDSPLRSVTSISRGRLHSPMDGFEDDLHLAKRTRQSADRKDARLSDVIPRQGPNRPFRLDPHRGAFGARDRGRMSRSPGLYRTLSTFSSLQSSSQGARTGIMSTFEESGWLENDRLPPSAGSNIARDQGRNSVAPSSDVLPSEFASIRSISPEEIGWIDSESPDGHGNNNDRPAQGYELGIINEAEPSESNYTAISETAAVRDNASVSRRGSRMSIGEDGILWERLTSVLEQEQQLLGHNTR
jgi:hypothetical protein